MSFHVDFKCILGMYLISTSVSLETNQVYPGNVLLYQFSYRMCRMTSRNKSLKQIDYNEVN